jgi:glycosyltransferase involved in cell wall biosynthesis
VSAVLVSHPHAAAFAVGVAGGLARAGRLSLFATGVAFKNGHWGECASDRLARRWPVLRNRVLSELPADRVRALPLVEIGARLAARAYGAVGGKLTTYDALFVAHDAAVALLSWPPQTGAVYAYEDAALRTFARAKRLDLQRIWDLPLPHYQTIEALWRAEAERWPDAFDRPLGGEPGWKRRRKDQELELATRIVVASGFTRQSLESLNVRASIAVIPYGFPVDLFVARRARPEGRFTVLSVGTHDLRKGTPYLLEAWRRAAIPDAELHLVGPLKLAKTFVDRYAGLFRHSAHVPKSDLGAHYGAADLLAFPTLGDGFGLVMQEAMCCGTPVVTTPCGGGPECITDGVDGWLVPPRDIDALVERFRDAAANREESFVIGVAARERAERWTWRDAGDALVRTLDA